MVEAIAELLIDPDEVEAAFHYCRLTPKEEAELERAPIGIACVDGITKRFRLHLDRLREKREKIKAWLLALPYGFRKPGGSWFLNASRQANGRQWSESQDRIEQLFLLGMGLDLVEYQMPRELWTDGLPCCAITIE